MRSGQRVGKYILGEQIGRGGMAEVWSARAEGPGGFVKSLALKFIADSFAGDLELERLFVNEARVAAQLQHANLVAVFDFDKWSDPQSAEPGRYYIAMERVDGQDLRRLLQVARHKGQRVSPALALHIAGEVLKGLRYVHERREGPGASAPWGLVHRDVSPHNVLIGLGGEVKLSDFGIAKVMSQSLGTQAGMVRGKLAYASPEQLRGEPVDHRADQFALGVTLWEMLAERRLFDGTNEVEIVGKVLRCEIPSLPPSVAPEVDQLTRRMLASAPGDRFPSTADALAAVLAAPGYLPQAPALIELMQALFAPRPLVLPPTVPMKITDIPRLGGLAETSELEGTPSEARAPRADVPEVAVATGSGYVSGDTPHVASWMDHSGAEEPPRRRLMPMAVVLSIGVAASLVLARRWTSTATVRPASSVADGPRPVAKQPVRIAAAPRSPGATATPPVAPAGEAPGPQPASLPRRPAGPPAVAPSAAASDGPAADSASIALPEGIQPGRTRRRSAGRPPLAVPEPRPLPALQPAPAQSPEKKRDAANGAPILE